MYCDNMGIPLFLIILILNMIFWSMSHIPQRFWYCSYTLPLHPCENPSLSSLRQSVVDMLQNATVQEVFLSFSFWELFMGSSWWEICLLPGNALRDGVELPLAQLQTQKGRELLMLQDSEPCHLTAWARSCSLSGLLYPGLTSLFWHLPHCVTTYKLIFLSLGASRWWASWE